MIDFSYFHVHRDLSWDEAWLYCLCLNHNGHKDWRMPTFDDYQTTRRAVKWPSCWIDVGDEDPSHSEPLQSKKTVIPVRFPNRGMYVKKS